MSTYAKRFISPTEYIYYEYLSSGVVRAIDPRIADNYFTLIGNPHIEVIPYTAPEKTFEEAKKEKVKEIELRYKEALESPLKVSDSPEIYIKQTAEDLDLWEKGLKGFLMNAYELGYFIGDIALTEEEIADLMVGTIKGSLIIKARNFSVNPIDYYGNPLYIDIATMVEFTLKIAIAFQRNFMEYHLLLNKVNAAETKEDLVLIKWY